MLGFDIIHWKNSPSLSLLGLHKMKIRTIIDVGANTGQFAQSISQPFPSAKLYCFEPLPGPYSNLSEWADRQKGRVVAFNLALGDEEKEIDMFLHETHTPSSSILHTTKINDRQYPFTKKQSKICVRQTTLDSAFNSEDFELEPDILIKVDVQGYENRVIAGGRSTFTAASACILEICIDHLYEGQADFEELFLMLRDLNYQYAGNLSQVYGDDGHCVYIDALFINFSPADIV